MDVLPSATLASALDSLFVAAHFVQAGTWRSCTCEGIGVSFSTGRALTVNT